MAKETAAKTRKCVHPFYHVAGGRLVCTQCGEPSPKASMIDGVPVPIKPKAKCPKCGHEFEVTA
jgi:ribosomal protein L37E